VGPAGRDGFGVLAYTGNSESVPAGDDTIVDTSCSPGTHPTGGSAYAVDSAGDPVDDVVKDDYLSLDGWQARAGNSTGGDVTVIVEAACANGTVVVNTARAATRRAR
jgi:hypothetical protein